MINKSWIKIPLYIATMFGVFVLGYNIAYNNTKPKIKTVKCIVTKTEKRSYIRYNI